MGHHLDHHVTADFALCDWVARDYFCQVIATFNRLQLGCGVYYSLNIYATLVDVLGMQVSLLHTGDYSHKPSIKKKASNDVHHIKIHHESWKGHWYSHHMCSAVNNYYKQELYHNLEFIYLRTHDYAIKNNHCDILCSIHIHFII